MRQPVAQLLFDGSDVPRRAGTSAWRCARRSCRAIERDLDVEKTLIGFDRPGFDAEAIDAGRLGVNAPEKSLGLADDLERFSAGRVGDGLEAGHR